MPTERKFYKTIFTITVLSEDPLKEIETLGELNYEITMGSCSGHINQDLSQTIDGPTAARLLEEQGSDPEFFELTSDGEDIYQG